MKQKVRRKAPNASKRVLPKKDISSPQKVDAPENQRHRKKLGSSQQTLTKSANESSMLEQGRSDFTQESRPIAEEMLFQVDQASVNLLSIVHQLERWSQNSDMRVSRTAFEALAETLDELLRWLSIMAVLPEASLGALLRHLPSEDAWERYKRGEHVAAWAGVKLARLYKRIGAELRSRSKNSVNHLHDLQFGLRVGTSERSPNKWFCAEYDSRADYRPTGEMAVWMARKIEEVRLLKDRRSLWWPLSPPAPLVSFIEPMLPALFRTPEMVKGKGALKQLDDLPPFGDSHDVSLDVWRKFLRRQLLTQTDVVAEFERIFPQARKKVDGVLTSTLRYAWQAVQAGGQIFFPALSGPCK